MASMGEWRQVFLYNWALFPPSTPAGDGVPTGWVEQLDKDRFAGIVRGVGEWEHFPTREAAQAYIEATLQLKGD